MTLSDTELAQRETNDKMDQLLYDTMPKEPDII